MLRITRLGGPTTLVEVDGWRILTDPTFDPPGRRYSFGFGTSSHKVSGPALELAAIGPVDVVLLSHDQHGDNLDDAGRAMLPTADTVVTTRPAARRLRTLVPGVRGLRAGASTVVERDGRAALTVTATPARHGPPLSRPIVGAAIGFRVRVAGDERDALWMTGDTVAYGALRDAADATSANAVLIHLGGVGFPVSGPVRYSMTASTAIDILGRVRTDRIVPVHVDGWSHFREGEEAARLAFAAAPESVRDRIVWLTPGVAFEV